MDTACVRAREEVNEMNEEVKDEIKEVPVTAEESVTETPAAEAPVTDTPTTEAPASEASGEEAPAAAVPSMDEFSEELNNSFKNLKEGDLVKGTVVGISDTEVTVDLGSYAEGIIKAGEVSNDPHFSIKTDIAVGDTVEVQVLGEDKNGSILLSKKKADDTLNWASFKEMMDAREVITVKVAQAVKAGVVAYVKGVRAFIPASQIATNYIENLETVVGQKIDTVIITVDEEKKRLVLSGREAAKDRAAAEKAERIAKVQKGMITTGKVEKIMPFGAFIDLGDGLSGLVHISQISQKRVKTVEDALKEGDEVKVKVLDIKDGKISLSIKAAADQEPAKDPASEGPREYRSGGDATTSLGDMLAKLKL